MNGQKAMTGFKMLGNKRSGLEIFKMSVPQELTEKIWNTAVSLAGEFEGSRELLSLGPHLSSINGRNGSIKVFDHLLDTAHLVLHAEHVFFLQLDADQRNLVVTHSRTQAAVGVKMSEASGELSISLSQLPTSLSWQICCVFHEPTNLSTHS